MRTRRWVGKAVAIGVLAVLGLGVAAAQDAPARTDRRRRFDPAQMRQRMMTRMKENLKIDDEAWKVLQPRIEKVMTLSRDAGARGMFFGGRRRRTRTPDQGGEAAEPQSDTAKAVQELQKTLENEAATAEEIKAKLKALREAREKAKQELAKAQEAVRELVTQRQEAQLVLMGYLN